MDRILIIGNGVVGNATGRVLEELKYKVDYYDIDEKKSTIEKFDIHEFNKTYEFIFVCVPTPTVGGKQNLNSITTVMYNLEEFQHKIVLRSTVLPGTCNDINKKYPNIRLIHFPEFLTEKAAFFDCLNPDRLVLSGEFEDVLSVLQLFDNLPKRKHINIFTNTDYNITEMVKYANNYVLATKVTIANELFDMCKEIDIDYNTIRNMLYQDRRISQTHLDVTKERGFGGSCFPKDMSALLSKFPKSQVLNSIIKYNKSVRKE